MGLPRANHLMKQPPPVGGEAAIVRNASNRRVDAPVPIGRDVQLDAEQQRLLDAGRAHFDAGRFWHAHEDWEDLWKSLKGVAPQSHVDGVQGLIQVAAMLFQYIREKERGVRSLWEKATAKLLPLGGALYGLDIERLLEDTRPFHEDVVSRQAWGRPTRGLRLRDSQEGGSQND